MRTIWRLASVVQRAEDGVKYWLSEDLRALCKELTTTEYGKHYEKYWEHYLKCSLLLKILDEANGLVIM